MAMRLPVPLAMAGKEERLRVCGVTVSMAAFQAVVPGSTPGTRTSRLFALTTCVGLISAWHSIAGLLVPHGQCSLAGLHIDVEMEVQMEVEMAVQIQVEVEVMLSFHNYTRHAHHCHEC